MNSSSTGPSGLRRDLKRRHLTMITLGGIIGGGLFLASGSVIHAAGPAATIAYIAGGILVVLVMRMLAEMSTASTTQGSFAEYARSAIGPWAGFLTGWLYWWFWVVIVAFEATAAARIVNMWLPGPPQWALSLFFLLAFLVANLASVRIFGEMEFWFASIKVIVIIALLVIGSLFALGLWPGAVMTVDNLWNNGGFLPNGWGPVLSATVAVVFSYFGAEVVTVAAGESSEPRQVIARATRTVVARLMLFFVGAIFVITMVIPWSEAPVDTSPFAAAFSRFGIPYADTVVSVVVLTAVLSCLNAGIYVSSRTMFGLANNGDAPKVLTRTSANGAPVPAILLGVVVGLASVVAAYAAPEQVFSFLLNSCGAVGLMIYLMISLSQLRFRARFSAECNGEGVVRMWLYPYLTWLAIIWIVVALGAMAFVEGLPSQLWTTLVTVALTILGWVALVARRNRPLTSGVLRSAFSRHQVVRRSELS